MVNHICEPISSNQFASCSSARVGQGGGGAPLTIDLQCASADVAQDHVGFAEAREIAEACNLPIQADGTQRRGVDDGVVADVVDLKGARAGIAQHHVGHAVMVEVAEAGHLPIQANRPEEGSAGNIVVAAEEAAQAGKLPLKADLSKLVARQNRIVADIVDLVEAAT